MADSTVILTQADPVLVEQDSAPEVLDTATVELVVESADAAVINTTENVLQLAIDSPATLIETPVGQGPAGPPGPAGGSIIQRTAGESLSALRTLYELGGQVFVLDASDTMHADLAIGVSLTAVNAGEQVDIQVSGTLDESAWSWLAGPIYNGASGIPTQIPPTSGAQLFLGSSPGGQRLNVALSLPYYL